jgi:ABC-type antimicrobial peptide transport system permease subunit
MNYYLQLLLEAFVVGISTVIMGTVVGFIVGKAVPSNVSTTAKGQNDWNKYYVMEISLFFTGFCLHLVYEILGLNSWYCKDIFASSR